MNSNVFQRHEIKYLVSAAQRAAIERAMQGRMTPDEHGESTVCSIYYDTPDFRLIRRSLEGPVYKEKLRLRSYGPVGADGTVFLEMKKKYRGIVYKRRTQLSQRAALDYLAGLAPLPEQSQIGRELDYFLSFYGDLEPRVYLSCERRAWFSREDENLRLTFDKNILWRAENLSLSAQPGGAALLRPGETLMEIKTATALPLWLVDALTAAGARKSSFSKYGRAYEGLMAARSAVNGGVHCA